MSYPSGVHPGAHSHEKLPIVSTQTWVSYEDDHLIKSNVFKLNITQVFEFNSFIRRSVAFFICLPYSIAIWYVTYRDLSSTWITFMNTFFTFIYVDTLAQIIARFFWIFIILKTINTFAIIGAQSINTFMILTWLYYVQTFVDIQTFISIATIPLNFCGFSNNLKL